MTKEIQNTYVDLNSITENGNANDKRARGRKFEGLLRMILANEEMNPQINFRPKGEEIDGSFILGDRIFLLEAKWHEAQIPASAIYSFKGKVDGKLIGTIGIFISMSGYSEDAVNALSLGKSLNVLLFDKDDIDSIIIENNTFKDVLLQKLRKAAEKGIVYYPIKSSIIKYNHSNKKPELSYIETSNIKNEKGIVIICEGISDKLILESILKRIIGESDMKDKNIIFVPAGGKYQVPKIGQVLLDLMNFGSLMLFVVDSDNEIEQTELLLAKEGFFGKGVFILNPSIEVWIGMNKNQTASEFYSTHDFHSKIDRVKIERLVSQIDFQELEKNNQKFNEFITMIKEYKNHGT